MYKMTRIVRLIEMYLRVVTGGRDDARNSTDVIAGGASVVQHGLL